MLHHLRGRWEGIGQIRETHAEWILVLVEPQSRPSIDLGEDHGDSLGTLDMKLGLLCRFSLNTVLCM
jgi:hypothetical protein